MIILNIQCWPYWTPRWRR